MNTSATSHKTRPAGAWGFFDEIGSFEMEAPSLASMAKGIGELVVDAVKDLGETNEQSDKLSIGGQTEIEFNQRQTEAEKKLKQKEETDRVKTFNLVIEQDRQRAQQAKEKMLLEEEIIDISANLPTDEKNKLLHYQASYKDKSVYQLSELRKKLIEQRRKTEKQEKDTTIPSPAKKASALEAAYEGGSGTQGSGTANLSANATG